MKSSRKSKSKKRSPTPKQLHDKEYKRLAKSAWIKWSRLVRTKGMDPRTDMNQCYTCGKWLPALTRKFHAGHYHHTNRGKWEWSHTIIDYHPLNIKPQCEGCNGKFGKGKPREFADHLVQEHGDGVISQLYKLRRENRPLTLAELKILNENLSTGAPPLQGILNN